MSTNQSRPQTEEEWYDRALTMLNNLGVNNPEVGVDGSIPVSPRSREVISVQITESTSTRQRMLNQLPRDPEETLLIGGPKILANYGNPVCNMLGCAVISRLPRECSYVETTWTDPDIVADSLPNRIPETTAYLNPFNARIEGDVEYELGNSSEPGEKHTQTIYKCQSNGPKETEVREDSAIIDSNSDTRFRDADVDETIEDVQHAVDDLQPDTSATAEVEFQKNGALDVIEALYNAWTQGYMTAEAEGTLTVNYEWRGSNKTKEFDVSTRVRIPVSNINYSW